MPRGWHALLRLKVVSYGLPALIAVGALIYMKRGGDTMFRSLLRMATPPRHDLIHLINDLSDPLRFNPCLCCNRIDMRATRPAAVTGDQEGVLATRPSTEAYIIGRELCAEVGDA